MKCHRPEFINLTSTPLPGSAEERPVFPDMLTDYITGREIPFTNRDNIRQKIIKFLVEEKGYLKEDIRTDREIHYEVEGGEMVSLVDISLVPGGRTQMVWKCASGSVVSRERQIIASARLLENHIVPFAVVTNGKEVELLDTITEKIKAEGFDGIPSREELLGIAKDLPPRLVNPKKIPHEQRILYTYDAIACPSSCRVIP
jgi:Type I restriction enzyme R protein N terminus (HSDR_N)